MAVTVAQLADLKNVSWGPIPVTFATVTLDASYPTGGYGTSLGLNAAAFSLRGITGIWTLGWNTAAAGYFFQWNVTTSKLMAYAGAGFTPSGTISGNVVVKGGAIGEAIGINPDSNAGVLSKAAATDRTIPYATFLGGALAFTGAAVAAGMVEVSSLTNLSALTITVVAFGIR
jgi:hypothetical protein